MKDEENDDNPIIKLEPNTEFSIERDVEGKIEVGCAVTLNVSGCELKIMFYGPVCIC